MCGLKNTSPSSNFNEEVKDGKLCGRSMLQERAKKYVATFRTLENASSATARNELVISFCFPIFARRLCRKVKYIYAFHLRQKEEYS